MKVTLENLQLLHSALTHFVSEAVADVSRFENSILFKTDSGRIGLVERNFFGNYNIIIGEDVVYEIEKELYEIIEADRNERTAKNFLEFYDMLKKENTSFYQPQSIKFFEILKNSVENIILNYNLPLEGEAIVGSYQIHYTNQSKIKINLN